jgi:phenylacetate-CoA ligase
MIPEIETRSLEEIIAFQEIELQGTIRYLSDNSPYYSELFKKNDIDPKSIKRIDDLLKIPVTSKDDLQQRTKDFVCVDARKIIDYNTTSGTLGDPVTFALSDSDLDRLAYNEYISLSCSKGNVDDIYQLMVTIDRRFMAGIAYYLGIRKMGAGMVRVGPGNPQLQFDTINRIKPTALITVPSFLIKLIEYAEKEGIDINSSSVKKAVCIGEPIRNNDFSLNTLGKRIREKWDLELFSTYASTEMGTAFNECEYGCGGHHHPEMIIVEFLDENNQPVAENEPGEVVITTLGVETMPLLRFKTGDVCYHYTAPCKCGRTTMRLGPVLGRKQQMIKYKGTTLYPSAIYDILNEIDFIENYFIEVTTGDLGTDEVSIKLGCKAGITDPEKIIKDRFRAKLRVAPEITVVAAEEINRLQLADIKRKPIVFSDNRV